MEYVVKATLLHWLTLLIGCERWYVFLGFLQTSEPTSRNIVTRIGLCRTGITSMLSLLTDEKLGSPIVLQF